MNRNSALTRTALALLCILLGVGTSAGSQQDAAVYDSSGVRIVVLPSDGPAPSSADTTIELYRTLGELELYHVSGAVFLPDGGLAIANSGAHEIVFLDPEGAPVRRYGREGQGPGEFASIRAIGLTAEDVLWAYDDRLGRLTMVPEPGEEPRTRPLRPADRVTSLEPLLVDPEGPVLAIRGEHRMFQMTGESRDTVPLFLVHPDGAADTLGRWPGLEKAFTEVDGGGAAQMRIGFGRDLYTGGHAGAAVLGSSDAIDLSVFVHQGELIMKIVGESPSVPVSESTAAAWRRERADGLSEYPKFAAGYLKVRVSETYPAFDALAMDERERVWLGLHPAGRSTQTWWIIGRDGPEASVVGPADGTPLAAMEDRMVVLRRNDLDEEFLVVFRIDSTRNSMETP